MSDQTASARRIGTLHFPPELPVTDRLDDLAAAVEAHQVVIVAGETGSGKTTQLPKLCLAIGRGSKGMIGHTQPRRIAARTVAARIAEECGVELGTTVGYAVRFSERTGKDTAVRVMTDGLLLAEIRRDPELRRYDTVIVDEAHERSLSIDFLLGYLRRLLPRRPDLKLIITSATIDPERFAELFGERSEPTDQPSGPAPSRPAPIIEVSGRTYPVEKRYRPLSERDDGDQLQAISDAVDELYREPRGDILVFLSGEREIRDTADMLEQRRLRDTEVLPLYARLSTAEQQRVFKPHGMRRIVLATNVAETSLTVPGIKYVVDPGTARISRYSQRLKVQRLPIEPISQASADQRAGRCGRTSDGICIRLYSEEDYESRPRFTEPEILRTSLASVILTTISLGLGDVSRFPFPDPPDNRAVRDGMNLLHELGALENGGEPALTPVGRAIADLPLDPRWARMLVEADRNGCLREVLVIVSALSIQDPRERPADQRDAADAKHRRFGNEGSDFAAFLDLWRYLRARRRELSGNQFRRMCREEFLHYLRIREWQDVHTQLRQSVRDLGMTLNDADAAPDRVHQSLLAGLLSHIGLRDPDAREYVGARNARFAIFPASALAKSPPRWVMAAELVETSRLWARTAARIDPDWIEPLAGHLLKRTYSEPHWSKRRAAVMAHERVTLYGVPVVVDRRVSYGRIDPVAARELFIRHALVQGEWSTRHAFFAKNRRMLEDVADLEDRSRRRDILVDDDTLYAFYDERLPDTAVSGRHFDSWWKRRRKRDPDLLDFERSLLMRDDAPAAPAEQYPDVWTTQSHSLPLSYAFEPGTDADGVTVDVPIEELPTVDADDFWWHVPGHREELVASLIKTLPKGVRRGFVPARQTAQRVLTSIGPQDGPLLPVLARALQRDGGVDVSPDTFDTSRLPEHLLLRFRVTDGDRIVAEGRDLQALQHELRPRLRHVLSDAADDLTRDGMTDWAIDALPEHIDVERHGHTVRGFPSLVDDGDSVGVRVLESADEQRFRHPRGVSRLLALTTTSPVPLVAREFDNATKLTLADNPYGSVLDLLEDARDAALDDLVARHGGERVRDAEAFARLRETVRSEAYDGCAEAVRLATETLAESQALARELGAAPSSLRAVVEDVRVQESWLVYDGFVRDTGLPALRQLPRYLRAARMRVERAPQGLAADAASTAVVTELEADYYAATETMPAYLLATPQVRETRWALEELRVSLFAQTLGTARTVSPKRVRKLLGSLPASR